MPAHRRSAIWPVVVAVALLAGCAGASDADEPLLVAAASDLQPAFTELGRRFESETGLPVTFSFGSSGQLAQQIAEGSPADVFASADSEFVDKVLQSGRGDEETRETYATGRLAMWADADRWGGWSDLDELAADSRVRTIAIANPDHAPYGRAAREALARGTGWEEVQSRLVFGESVVDAHRLAASGNADVAITALSLALAGDRAVAEDTAAGGRWQLVPQEAHPPLRQELIVVTDQHDRAERAQALVDFLRTDEARAVMRAHGFLRPGEEPPESWTVP